MWVISLTSVPISGKLSVGRDGFLQCPYCGNRKLLRVSPNTEARGLPIWCRKCQREITVDIARGQCQLSRSPGRSEQD
ncbi:MAG: hypothetical protein IKD61_06985 [Oscillospiraceae bacterium]|nr:hypothetical protein [Oscillospiraceae bacterium]